MTLPTGFFGRAKRMDPWDPGVIARDVFLTEDHIRAIMDVEAAGSGFDAKGRPKMLFEPHIFYRKVDLAKRHAARAKGVAYSSWGAKPYPADSYPRLQSAMAIDRKAAFLSASWGLGQVMGFNHANAGYPNAEDMVAAFCDDEEVQLLGMVRFIKNAGLDGHARNEDWVRFARGYNGPGFAKHGYHIRLAARFKHWRAVRDTPAP